jgi:hypothetical protein
LIALGCLDPVERIEALKARDPRRQRIAELFNTWWEHHRDSPVKIKELAEAVTATLDIQGRSRQYLASLIGGYVGTHASGFVLTRLETVGKWTPLTYVLKQIDSNGIGHRGHRGLGAEAPQPPSRPMIPMTPMPYGVEADDDGALPAGGEAKL